MKCAGFRGRLPERRRETTWTVHAGACSSRLTWLDRSVPGCLGSIRGGADASPLDAASGDATVRRVGLGAAGGVRRRGRRSPRRARKHDAAATVTARSTWSRSRPLETLGGHVGGVVDVAFPTAPEPRVRERGVLGEKCGVDALRWESRQQVLGDECRDHRSAGRVDVHARRVGCSALRWAGSIGRGGGVDRRFRPIMGSRTVSLLVGLREYPLGQRGEHPSGQVDRVQARETDAETDC